MGFDTGMGGGFNLIFSLFPIFFFLIFGIVLAVIIATLVGGARQYRRNNASPVLTVDATVSDKRTDVRMSAGSHHHSEVAPSGASYYYATFEVQSGDRMELALAAQEYGLLAPGDRGKLTFQGTRYLGFERSR